MAHFDLFYIFERRGPPNVLGSEVGLTYRPTPTSRRFCILRGEGRLWLEQPRRRMAA